MISNNVYFGENTSDLISNLKNKIPEYQERVKQIDMENLSRKNLTDSFEKFDEAIDIMYACYPNYQIIKGMPESLFGDQFGYDMQKTISDCMKDFYAGKMSQSEMTDFFEECCTSMRKYRTQ